MNYVCVIYRLIMLKKNGGLSCIINYVRIIIYGDLMHIWVSRASKYFPIMMSTNTYITIDDL